MNCRYLLPVMFGMVTVIYFNTSEVSAQDNFSALTAKIPKSANALILIDADALRSSPLGKQENWADKNEAAYVNSPFYLPPEATKIVVGSQVNSNHQLEQAWEVAVMNLSEPISSRAIARAEGGEIDTIADMAAVWSPSDAYFVQFSSQLLGIMAPANRQKVSHWAKTTGSESLDAAGVFAESVNDVNDTTQIVLAINLKDAVVPHQLREWLSSSELLKDDATAQASWQTVVESLTGAKLAISVTTKIQGRLEVQFESDPSVLGKKAKEGILQTFQKFGVAFEDLEHWTLSQSQNNLILDGELSLTDLRKVMSLLQVPSSKFSALADVEPAEADDQDKVVKASQKYFRSVSTLLDDLHLEFKTNRDARKNFAATYMQRYAKRIDKLPILNVDVELVDYGLSVSETLRSTSVTQGQANIETGVRKSRVYSSNYSNGYYNDYRSSSSIKTQIAREEQGEASKVRFENWKEMQDATAQIRVKMTQKYKVDF
ncbi:hypothetical protein [Thalassoglobus polymorphus]|uniref:Uncharacterized protein n=1 Tax=Thalassoglobus polymorphus TaxID=2527994 RepID=A0A517QGM5_9PLAN|nr:hypothetical protein [Thalassoglobus polymorphus]QDT30782.1 hypothetical protein Mal48_00090 [Thalassoglobus polymorphus]